MFTFYHTYCATIGETVQDTPSRSSIYMTTIVRPRKPKHLLTKHNEFKPALQGEKKISGRIIRQIIVAVTEAMIWRIVRPDPVDLSSLVGRA